MRRTLLIPCIVLGLSVGLASTNANDEIRSADPNVVQSLVDQLGHPEFRKREDAHRKLTRLGEESLAQLESLDPPTDPEIAWRIAVILRTLRIDPLINTSWQITCSAGVNVEPTTLTFLDGGRFLHTKQSGSDSDDTWEIKQGKLHFHYNDKFASYQGRQISEDEIAGSATNVKGKSWTWTGVRVQANRTATELRGVDVPMMRFRAR